MHLKLQNFTIQSAKTLNETANKLSNNLKVTSIYVINFMPAKEHLSELMGTSKAASKNLKSRISMHIICCYLNNKFIIGNIIKLNRMKNGEKNGI